MTPLVSVIIPVFNMERFLGAALASVLQQDHADLEIVVVDDGSTDASAAVAVRFSTVRYVRQANQGLPVARNTGLAASRGRILMFLDADDVWTPGKIEAQVSHLRDQAEVLVSYGRWKNFLDPGVPRPFWVSPDSLEEGDPSFWIGTVAFRREVVERVGGFDPAIPYGDDTDWQARLQEASVPMAALPDVLALRRIHQGNMSHDGQARKTEVLLQLVRAKRQRQQRPQP